MVKPNVFHKFKEKVLGTKCKNCIKVPTPDEINVNGDAFNTQGGKFMYQILWELRGQVSGNTASIRVLMALVVGFIIAKMTGALD